MACLPFFGKLISKKIDGFKLLSLLFIIDILIFVWNISICEVRTYSYLHRIRLQINQNAVSYALYREHWLALFSYVRRYLIMIIINNFYSAGFWSWKSSQQKYTRGTSLPVQCESFISCFDRKSINSKPAYEIDIKIIPKYYALTLKINWLLFLRCDFLFVRLINGCSCMNIVRCI